MSDPTERFRVLRSLGRGGFGEVQLVYDTERQQQVALAPRVIVHVPSRLSCALQAARRVHSRIRMVQHRHLALGMEQLGVFNVLFSACSRNGAQTGVSCFQGSLLGWC